MKKLHLNWDGNQNNGIIFNDKYEGAIFYGEHLKPSLSFDYDYMQYSEVFNNPNYIKLGNSIVAMTKEQENEVKKLASTWVQEEGQEGSKEWLAKMEHAKQCQANYEKEFIDFLATKGKKLTIQDDGLRMIEDM